jgi:hypothetical protein
MSKEKRRKKREERRQKRKERRKKRAEKLKRYLIPPQLYPFIPLMKRYLDKNGYPYDKKSPRDIVFQFYRRFVKKERNFDGSDYIHINDYLAINVEHSDGGQIKEKKNLDPVSFASIVTAVINFIKTLIDKSKKKKQGELAPDEREMADEFRKTDEDPKSKEIVERAKKEQEEAEKEIDTKDDDENYSLFDRILIALGLKKRKRKRKKETYYYVAHIENYADPVIETDPENPLVLVRERIYNPVTGKYKYVWRSPYLKNIPKAKRKASFDIARDIIKRYDIKSLKKDINNNNTKKVFLKLDSIIREADTKPVLSAISHILMNKHRIYLLKVIRMFPKDIYTDLYNKILNLKP